MEVFLGIAIGVSAIESLMLVGVYLVVSTDAERWRDHRRQTSDRLNGAWKVTEHGLAPVSNGNSRDSVKGPLA